MGRILESPGHAYRRHPVDELGLYVDGHDYYREFYRAALTAKRTLVLAGWQFDSEVPLLRGSDALEASTPITLLKFLDHLCETNPNLQIWILAWDFHYVFVAEREWMQQLVFHWSTNERLKFRFDSNHVERGCHHQKFVVIDGELSFLGGLDLCEDRWDDRHHRAHNALRVSRGKPHKPFHDIQAFARGRELAASLSELFARRWELAGGEPIAAELMREPVDGPSNYRADRLVPIAATSVALSRTDPMGVPEGPSPCTEVLKLHEAAIASAQRLIYAETQYLSSHKIAEALVRRMRIPHGPKLELVFILNMRGETLKETAAVGLAQAKHLGRLRKVAEETGHQLGLFYTLPSCEEGEDPEQATYIHSKLMIVDDRFLTVGSANLTNRSMGVDTELNLTVEADGDAHALVQSIRAVRLQLLTEHSGVVGFDATAGLVDRLEIEAGNGSRLRRHPSPTEGERTAIGIIDPELLPWDPDHVEELDDERKRAFKLGISRTVREMLAPRSDKR
jgi:phospholipase D1/2